jgi:hypothetical protein
MAKALAAAFATLVLLSYFAAFSVLGKAWLYTPQYTDSVWGLVGIGLRVLAWPGLAWSRLGFSHGWLAVGSTLLALGLTARFLGVGGPRFHWRSRPVFAVLLLASYCLFALLYVFVLPIPIPAYSIYHLQHGKDVEALEFMAGYEAGYRAGMVDDWGIPNGGLSRAVAEGLWQGYLHGLREWEGLVPGVTIAAVRAVQIDGGPADGRRQVPENP